MPHELLDSINKYGYLVLFFLVFIQEIGVPTFPNEITLCYFGYLCSQNLYSLSQSILIAVSADVLGTLLLYSVFFFFSKQIFHSEKKWIKKILLKIESVQHKRRYRSNFSFFIGRLTPFVRGYVSVFAGITQLPIKIYFLQVLVSALLFTGGLITVGFCFANHIQKFLLTAQLSYSQFKIILFVILCLFVVKWFFKKIWFTK